MGTGPNQNLYGPRPAQGKMIVVFGSADLVDGGKLAPAIFGNALECFHFVQRYRQRAFHRNGASPFAQLTLNEATRRSNVLPLHFVQSGSGTRIE